MSGFRYFFFFWHLCHVVMRSKESWLKIWKMNRHQGCLKQIELCDVLIPIILLSRILCNYPREVILQRKSKFNFRILLCSLLFPLPFFLFAFALIICP